MTIFKKVTIGHCTLIHADCMEVMRELPDKAFDLAIVDPPYGINVDKMSQGKGGKRTGNYERSYKKGYWDSCPPNKNYFDFLFRVSHEQIIWGANYYPENLFPSSGWILWDKGQRLSQSDGELAFSSIKKPLRVFTQNRVALLVEGTIHPTQKPVALYSWLLTNYAKQGQTILDTHLGSGSSAIAANKLGFKFTGIELDEDYFNSAVARIEQEYRQVSWLDQPVTSNEHQQLSLSL